MNDVLLSLSRMARRLGVTQAWLRQQANAGNVPHLKAGTRYLFSPSAVEAALAKAAASTKAVAHA
jgi:excisionase family DNA binding protein